ncbi:MAG: ribosome-associated translation inhibitor RaiA [Oligoflexales bacterium]
MQCHFSFKHMETSSALEQYALGKITNKIKRYATKSAEAWVTFSVDGHEHNVHCRVRGGDGFNCEVKAGCTDMYGSVDLVVDKIEAQLKKQKEKIKSHRSSGKEILLETLSVPAPDAEDSDQVPVDAADVLVLEQKRKSS